MATLKYILTKETAAGPEAKNVLSVTGLTQNIRSLLEGSFSSVWVEGEISNFKFHSSGHMYFSLKDENAQIACVMFARENRSLGFEPAEGLKTVCFGRVSVYPVRGQYQIYIERMEPKGVGALQLRFQALKRSIFKILAATGSDIDCWVADGTGCTAQFFPTRENGRGDCVGFIPTWVHSNSCAPFTSCEPSIIS